MNTIPNCFDHFLDEMIRTSPSGALHSVYVVGSVLTPDFDPDHSDINSIVVVDDITLDLLDFFVVLGHTYKKDRIAAPIMMTPGYIKSSLDVFPVEFLNFRECHSTVYGHDLMAGLQINRVHLRLQCEREVKSKFLWLHQGYLNALGDNALLMKRLTDSISGLLPLLKAIMYLGDREIPMTCHEAVEGLQDLSGLDVSIIETIFRLKTRETIPGKNELNEWFTHYYEMIKHLVEYVDALD